MGYTFLKGSSHLHNLFLSDLSNFTIKAPKSSKKDKNTGRVVSRSAGNPTASFFIVGTVVDSQLTAEDSTKLIAVQPLGRTIDRITAFLGAVSNMNDVVLPIANQGLVFSTYRKGNSGMGIPEFSVLMVTKLVQITMIIPYPIRSQVGLVTVPMFYHGK